jgi:hypothetical protein
VRVGLIILVVIVGFLVILEVGLRLILDLGNPLIYISDQQIGYLLAPNQRTRKLGNLIEINQYSMRSPNITITRSNTCLRVLLLGDSIANGGWWTDQSDTISEILSEQIKSTIVDSSFSKVEVLNASANSWNPRNELAYLQRFGTFNAQVVVLLINTDDLFGTAPTSVQVGRDRNYPDRKPALALIKAFQDFILPPKPIPEMAVVNAETGDRVGFNLNAIAQIHNIIQNSDASLLLAMTPLLRETGSGKPRDYELIARQRLTEFTENHKITYIDFLPLFNDTQHPESLYRDNIHLSPQANGLVSEVIMRSLLQLLQIPTSPTTH